MTTIIGFLNTIFWGYVLIYGLLFLFFFLVCYPLSLASRRLEQKWGNAV